MSVVAKLRTLQAPSSYTAIADDLVRDAFTRLQSTNYNPQEVDKNVRRRVYDALNVLSSMGFVARDGKHVQWNGIAGFMHLVGLPISPVSAVSPFPTLLQPAVLDLRVMQQRAAERLALRNAIAEKKARVAQLRAQKTCLQQIITRNASRDSARVTTGMDVLVSDSLEYVHPDPNRVTLPFLLVSTDAATQIGVEMDPCREEIAFRFDRPFQIHYGYDVLGQVCQQERDAEIKNLEDLLQNRVSDSSAEWPNVYDKLEDAPVGFLKSEVKVEPEVGSTTTVDLVPRAGPSDAPRNLNRRRTPPCFALHRPEFLR